MKYVTKTHTDPELLDETLVIEVVSPSQKAMIVLNKHMWRTIKTSTRGRQKPRPVMNN